MFPGIIIFLFLPIFFFLLLTLVLLLLLLILILSYSFALLTPSLDHFIGQPFSSIYFPFCIFSTPFFRLQDVSAFLPCCSLFLSPLTHDPSNIVFTLKLGDAQLLKQGKHYESLLSLCHQLEGDPFLFVCLPLTHRLLGWCDAANSSWWKVEEVVCINLPLQFMHSSGGLILWRHIIFFFLKTMWNHNNLELFSSGLLELTRAKETILFTFMIFPDFIYWAKHEMSWLVWWSLMPGLQCRRLSVVKYSRKQLHPFSSFLLIQEFSLLPCH